jgi:hypothetical protein
MNVAWRKEAFLFAVALKGPARMLIQGRVSDRMSPGLNFAADNIRKLFRG